MKSLKLQRTLRVLHLWIGLGAALFIVVMGLSGTIVVFRPYFEGAVAPAVTGGSTEQHAPLASIEEGLKAHFGGRITRIVFPESVNEPLLIQTESKEKQRQQLYVDPNSGAVLGLKPKLAWLDWTVDLHQNLLAGKTGRALTGVIGGALLLMSISGLWSWLAGRRDWKRSLAVPQAAPFRRVNYEGHVWAGLWVNLLLIVVSFTGIALAYPDSFRQSIRMVTGEQAPSSRPTLKEAVRELRPLDEYVNAAALALPGGVVRELRLPNNASAPVALTLWAPGDARPKGTNVVYLNPSTASVVFVDRSGPWTSSKTIFDFADAIHKTELGGLPVRIGFALVGLASVLLCLSGLQIWWHRRKTAMRNASRTRPTAVSTPTGELVHK